MYACEATEQKNTSNSRPQKITQHGVTWTCISRVIEVFDKEGKKNLIEEFFLVIRCEKKKKKGICRWGLRNIRF